MSYKRAVWTSGYTYRRNCEYCSTPIEYTDRQLGYRSWYPNGFIYCPSCKKPLRHNEIYAVNPDGSPVFKTPAEADASVRVGYYKATGAYYNAQAPQPSAVAYCPNCGKPYAKGGCNFCPSCGSKLS